MRAKTRFDLFSKLSREMSLFQVSFWLLWGSNESLWIWICGMASLDVYETGWRGKLGLGKISGPMQHHFNHFSKVLEEMRLFRGSFMVF